MLIIINLWPIFIVLIERIYSLAALCILATFSIRATNLTPEDTLKKLKKGKVGLGVIFTQTLHILLKSLFESSVFFAPIVHQYLV